jgi:hypothetical protein
MVPQPTRAQFAYSPPWNSESVHVTVGHMVAVGLEAPYMDRFVRPLATCSIDAHLVLTGVPHRL